MTYSLEDTIKFQNPKKRFYNLYILKNSLLMYLLCSCFQCFLLTTTETRLEETV